MTIYNSAMTFEKFFSRLLAIYASELCGGSHPLSCLLFFLDNPYISSF